MTPLLTACASVPATSVKPTLSAPPSSVVDALDAVGRRDASAGAWVVELSRFYRKQDVTAAH